MTGNITYDARRMFKHACAFTDCAYFCEREPNSIVVRTQWYTVPDIVNSAFACEVFIKSLLVYYGVRIEDIKRCGHGLVGLWTTLKNKDAELTNAVESSILTYFNTKREDFFAEMLGYISDAFETWRYIYEGHGAKINRNFLCSFRDCLRNACCMKLYNMTWHEFVSGDISWSTSDEDT